MAEQTAPPALQNPQAEKAMQLGPWEEFEYLLRIFCDQSLEHLRLGLNHAKQKCILVLASRFHTV